MLLNFIEMTNRHCNRSSSSKLYLVLGENGISYHAQVAKLSNIQKAGSDLLLGYYSLNKAFIYWL